MHAAIDQDPAVTAAVADFRATVVAIRGISLRLFWMPEGTVERAAEQEALDDAVAGMQARCDRIGLTLDELFALINLDLHRSGGAASRPTGEFLHALTRGLTDACNAEVAAYEAVGRAQADWQAATDARVAAQRACAGFAADWSAQ